MKSYRQTAILSLIEQQDIKTQEELAMKLQESVASLSRRLPYPAISRTASAQGPTPGGGYKYATAEKAEHGVSDRFVRMFIDSVISIGYSGNIIVIKTLSGSANVAGEAIDSMRWPEILGTLSGDNTIFVVARNAEEAPDLVDRFQEIIR